MPIYEYECPKCDERFEIQRSMADSDKVVRCPKCGSEDTRRIFSTFATSSGGGSCPPGVPT